MVVAGIASQWCIIHNYLLLLLSQEAGPLGFCLVHNFCGQSQAWELEAILTDLSLISLSFSS